MTVKKQLLGMTWGHSRGYDPMVATAERYCALHKDVEIIWEKRSLQAFADRPISEMASTYDLMVIDHPHVGEVAHTGELLALDRPDRRLDLDALAQASVGGSHGSYHIHGRQWALAIDAATPVAAYRADKLDCAPKIWSEVLDLARKGEVAFALIPINALMVFMGIAKNLSYDIAEDPAVFISRENARHVFDIMREITALMDAKCLESDPIAVLDWMGNDPQGPSYSPFGYGYTNYSREGYCPYPITFADAPGIRRADPRGTVIGGTGIAVSASCAHQDIAVDYAYWIAGAGCQSGLFFDAGGQPAHAAAWEDDRCNRLSRDFFRNTRQTLETSWLRPRYDGYMQFQDAGGDVVHACLSGHISVDTAIDGLEIHYRKSQK